jgi:hypothetical protein
LFLSQEHFCAAASFADPAFIGVKAACSRFEKQMPVFTAAGPERTSKRVSPERYPFFDDRFYVRDAV